MLAHLNHPRRPTASAARGGDRRREAERDRRPRRRRHHDPRRDPDARKQRGCLAIRRRSLALVAGTILSLAAPVVPALGSSVFAASSAFCDPEYAAFLANPWIGTAAAFGICEVDRRLDAAGRAN
jgi:hypothetical protein